MRLNKKLLAVVIIGAFAIILGYLFTTYSQLAAEQTDLDRRLTVAQNRIPDLVSEKESLEGQRGSARSALGSAQAKYPRELHSIEYGEHIWEIVEQCNLTMTSLSFPRPAARQEGPVAFQVVSLTLPVRGQLSDIFEFIRVLRTDDRFGSTEVKSISVSIEGEATSATISVDIYGHRR